MEGYKCYECYGSEYRCGTGDRDCACEGYGGKYCWEKKVVLILKKNIITKNNGKKEVKIRIDGKYDGYGRMEISDDYKNLKHGLKWSDFRLNPKVRDKHNCKKNQYYNKDSYKQLYVDIVPEDKGMLMNKGVYLYCKSCYDN
jgi:hypothetical protein